MGDFLGEAPEAYVEKPVDPDALKKTVHQGIERDGLGAFCYTKNY